MKKEEFGAKALMIRKGNTKSINLPKKKRNINFTSVLIPARKKMEIMTGKLQKEVLRTKITITLRMTTTKREVMTRINLTFDAISQTLKKAAKSEIETIKT